MRDKDVRELLHKLLSDPEFCQAISYLISRNYPPEEYAKAYDAHIAWRADEAEAIRQFMSRGRTKTLEEVG